MVASHERYIKPDSMQSAIVRMTEGKPKLNKWLRPVAKGNALSEKVAFTYHTPNCGGRCAMRCTTREGKLVKIEPNEWADNRYSLICLKGISEIERVYSPDRIRTPLKRVGKRGEGKFVPISWDEALTVIAGKLKKLKAQDGGKSILVSRSSSIEYPMPILTALLGAQQAYEVGIDIGIANGLEETTGDRSFGASYNETADWVNAKTVVLLGANILETTMTDAQFFFDAKEAGAKIISIDPTLSVTAAKSNQWIRIKPGTDSALLLAMIALVLENHWYQEDYLIQNTSAPFLIRSDNQTLLRSKDPGQEGDKGPFLVWDGVSQSLQPYNLPGIRPALEYEGCLEGLKLKTVFAAMKQHHQQHTVAWASRITEIPEGEIRDLASQYATTGPAVLGYGWGGPDKWGNADITGHAAGILAALTGNIGRKGGGVGSAVGHLVSWDAVLGSWALPPCFQPAPSEMRTPDFRTKPNSIKALLNLGNSITQHMANLSQTEKWLDRLELVVTIDPFHNTSADYSDIVLPACTGFESEYEINHLQINRGHVLLQQKVLDPLYESKSDFQIEKELSEKLGLEQHLPQTPADYWKARLHSRDPHLAGITLETLLANKGIQRLNVPREPYVGHLDQIYQTPSGKLELYHEKMIGFRQAIPSYEEPLEASSKNPLFKKYPLQLSQAHTKYRVHSQFVNAKWINELDPEPRIEINPQDARSRGLKTGDRVVVFNDRGRFQARCKLNQALRPGQIRQYEGWWTKHMAEGNLQNVTNDAVNPRQYHLPHGPVIPFNDTLVEVRKAKP